MSAGARSGRARKTECYLEQANEAELSDASEDAKQPFRYASAATHPATIPSQMHREDGGDCKSEGACVKLKSEAIDLSTSNLRAVAPWRLNVS